MCGIAGFIDRSMRDADGICRSMTARLAHRGPDDSGIWVDATSGVALGHRRLAILDVSPAGHQPMLSATGRFVLIFNGEIYNHLEIREALNRERGGISWRGHSDTETLLAAIEQWGLASTLVHCVGMFAFSLWDRSRRVLSLARDRIGEKPLYYGRQGAAFIFGSELKALRAHPSFRNEIDRGALALFLRHNYVPDPMSIFDGVKKLTPGTWLEVNETGEFGMPVPFWSASTLIKDRPLGTFVGDENDAMRGLEAVLGDAVGSQMVADVPLGAFLSGGVDSSIVVALMQARSQRPVRTFTIGFEDSAFDESPHARAVAKHLGTDHSEMIVTSREAMDVIPSLPGMYDEPFADSSQIPVALVSRLARKHVTVSLSGDGGDELFGGYTRYALARSIWRVLNLIPRPLRSFGASALRLWSPQQWDRGAQTAARLMPRRLRISHPGDRMHKLADLLPAASRNAVYQSLVSHWMRPADVACDASEPRSKLLELMQAHANLEFEDAMMFWDLLTYLPGDILAKVDRAAMAVSLETRVPMLDHRVVEFAWSLPAGMRVRSAQGKWLLRKVLYKYVPRELIERPKMGFGVPIDIWLRGPLRPWAEELLSEGRLRREGFFNPQPIRQRWAEHLGGRRNWAYSLWDILMFQAWHEQQAA